MDLRQLPATQAPLDGGAVSNGEGIVLRTDNRSTIAKMRYEDYQRTLRRLACQ